MSLVLVVIGLIILIVFPSLMALRKDMAQAATQSNLQSLLRATAAFAQANGCLPCPAPAATTGAGFAHLRGDTSASPAACNGCTNPEGIVPYLSMGVPRRLAMDGWGRWITMRVDPALTSSAFAGVTPTGTNGLCNATFSATTSPTVRAPGQTSSQGAHAAVVFVSYGPDGYGAFMADSYANGAGGLQEQFPSTALACSTNAGFEECNASQTTSFVDAPPAISETDPFGDLLSYMDRNGLVSYFGTTTVCTKAW
jgi:type II secretory pathway pseudopilin PulG